MEKQRRSSWRVYAWSKYSYSQVCCHKHPATLDVLHPPSHLATRSPLPDVAPAAMPQNIARRLDRSCARRAAVYAQSCASHAGHRLKNRPSAPHEEDPLPPPCGLHGGVPSISPSLGAPTVPWYADPTARNASAQRLPRKPRERPKSTDQKHQVPKLSHSQHTECNITNSVIARFSLQTHTS